jgi:plastocyanin
MRRGRALATAAVGLAVITASGAALVTTGGASTADVSFGRQPTSFPIANTGVVPAGAQRLHFEVGPITVKPGQNSISYTRRIPQPAPDGWIVGMRTNLRRADGTVPPVNVIHLHHGVWLNLSNNDATGALPERFFAAGEEKTVMMLPTGYGYAYHATDRWLLNWMLHNNLSTADQVWITYDVDLIPAGTAAAQGIQAARPIWMDVENPSAYPVFDVRRGTGTGRTYTFPDQASNPYPSGRARNTWTVDHDGVLLSTAGHLHPGGLYDDLWVTRAGATAPKGRAKPGAPDTAHLFRSVANYWEPAGRVSWDFAMTGTPSSWRPMVHKGDVLSISSTYDSRTAGWYESMGIMVVWMADTTTGGVDPFQKPVDVPGLLTHGHLPENNQHGGGPAAGSSGDLVRASSHRVPSGTVVPIISFAYQQGNMALGNTSVPAIPQGGTLVFRNDDAPQGIYHTITACAAPCDLSSGIAYPLANGSIGFDSGELGTGGAPAIGSVTWSVPTDLPPGTYTYFCRIHPFMRGAFRVLPK